MSYSFQNISHIALIIILGSQELFPQVRNEEFIEQILESVAQNVSEDYDYSEISERLNFYARKPLNLNTVTKEQLQELFFISPVQISSILNHRLTSGMFLDVLELQSLPVLDLQTVRWLMNFVIVIPPDQLSSTSASKLLNKASHDLILRMGQVLEKQIGFLAAQTNEVKKYAGSSAKLFGRYRYNYSNTLFASINFEKDAGEPLFSGFGNKGFDFYSGNIAYNGTGIVRKLIVGDYLLQFGQGLAMWAGSGLGKGSSLNTISKQNIGLRSYSSVNEALFLRGISATFLLKKIAFTPFYSGRKIDGNLSDSNLEISSISVSGLHRTYAEILNKNSAWQRVYGLHSEYENKDFNIGFTAFHTSFSHHFASGKSLYQQYNFTGSELSNIGLHYSYTFKNAYLFGELAHSLSSGYAGLNGVMSSIAPRVSIALLYRNYEKDYHSFFNQAISEGSNAINERGLYAGVVFKFNSKLDIYTYSEIFKFPWLKFRVDGPSSGYELFTQVNFSPNKELKISARFKQQIKEENSEIFNSGLEPIDKQNFRFEIMYKLSASFSLRNRAELVRYQKGYSSAELGYLTYQDIIYDPMSSKLSGNVRIAIFETPGFNSRVYSYENDVLYSYSVPAFQGKGLRFYINGRYTLVRGLDLWVRYALVNYFDQQTIGTGNDLISGNQRSDIRVQIRYQF